MKFCAAWLLLLGASVTCQAQPAIHLGAGGTWLPASHNDGIDATVLAPSVLASVGPRDGAVQIEGEFKLPLKHVTERAYESRFGSYVLRFDRRDAVVSAFGRVQVNRHRKVDAALLFGGSWIRTVADEDVIDPPRSTDGPADSRTKFAWSVGLDLLRRFARFNVILPQVRFHYPTGPNPEYRTSIGGAITWSPNTRWSPPQKGA